MRQKTDRISEYFALISVKQGVLVSDLFNAVVSARENGTSRCHALKIEFRGVIGQEAIFLVTKDFAVVGQFRVAEDFLGRRDIPFDSWMNSKNVRRKMKKEELKTLLTAVENLRKGMKKVNVEAKVLETAPPARVCTRYGNIATVTNALVADKTGSVKLCLWNEPDFLFRKGDTVQIKNALVLEYKGEQQLHLAKNGTVSVLSNAC